MQMSDFELGWFAGIIDGEGTICCSLYRRPKAVASKSIGMPCPSISVQNTSKPMIEQLASLCEKSGINYKINPPRFHPMSTMIVHRITINRKSDISALLTMIRPLLIAKLAQAKLVIEWISRWKDCRGRGKATPTDAERLCFTESLSALNHGFHWKPLKPIAATAWPETAGANAENSEGFGASQNGQSAATELSIDESGVQRLEGNLVEPSGSKRIAPLKLVSG